MNEEKNCDCEKKPWHHNKWLMKILIVFVIVWVWTSISNNMRAAHYIGETNGPATINVSGTGDIVATPDTATFSFMVTNEASSVGDAQTKTTSKMNAVKDFLKKSNIADADIQTTDYSIYPHYEYQNSICPLYTTNSEAISCPPSKNVLTGYDVSESVSIKIHDLSIAGTILSGIGEFGVTNVSGLSFTEANYDDLVKQAEEKAITDAKTNAQALAQNLGVRIVRLVSYSNQYQYPVAYATNAMMKADSVGSSAPQISAGQNKITANVNVVYEIQ